MPDARPRLRAHHLVDSLTFGGAELLLAELARAAPPAGIELGVSYLLDSADRSPGADRVRAAGVEPACVGIPPRLWTSALWRVRRHLAAHRPDVVHTHLPASDLLGGVAARSLGIPSVSTIHAIEWGGGGVEHVKDRLSAVARAPLRGPGGGPLRGGPAPLPRHRLGPPRARDHPAQRGGGCPRPGAGAAFRSELGLEGSDLVVATLSKLRPEKAHDVALGAAARLRERFPRLRLVVIGDGDGRPVLERDAAELGETVRFAGYRADVMAVLDAVDILLHPSRADAFPTTLLEAMAASVPVVATAVGGIPEIVEDGHTGALVSAPPRPDAFADALAPLLEDAELRGRLGAAGRRRFEERFTAGAGPDGCATSTSRSRADHGDHPGVQRRGDAAGGGGERPGPDRGRPGGGRGGRRLPDSGRRGARRGARRSACEWSATSTTAGLSAARNTALAEARAPLISQLDADDAWEPGYLEAVLPCFEDPAVGLAYTDALIVHADGRVEPYLTSHLDHPVDSFPELTRINPIAALTATIRTEAVRAVGGYASWLWGGAGLPPVPQAGGGRLALRVRGSPPGPLPLARGDRWDVEQLAQGAVERPEAVHRLQAAPPARAGARQADRPAVRGAAPPRASRSAQMSAESQRTPEQLRHHYEVERELADRLRSASREERKQLYAGVYDELFRRVPDHPQLTWREDAG